MNRRPPLGPEAHQASTLPDEYHLPPPIAAQEEFIAPPPGNLAPETLHAQDAQALRYWHQALHALRSALSGRRH
ncbi:hypothetical protein PGB34_00445 [Xenophilus arseniciresistens]|uniref:Uncharacterized protein n=1 Tax=Xenophilus arseniciresistens TaxID=1283306 RepID=A0AAE3N4L8_9BURK|nr:hypothetical protein [Xenophilus arseniciresistens]MDA7414818.1 hypothetical protein [Xenophilus arseniciresistens]